MRSNGVLVCTALLAGVMAGTARGQAPPRPWGITIEGGPLLARAQGTLATYLAGGYGVGARVHAAPIGSRLGVRVDGEYLTFGEQTRVRPYNGSGPPIDITTGSRIFMATAGPELRLAWRRLGAAIGTGAGMAYFSNTGAVDVLGDPDRFRRANSYGHVSWALRGGGLAKQLLAFARQQPRRVEAFDAGELLADTERLLRPLLGEKFALAVHRAPQPGYVRMDPGQFEQVMLNLAVNARDAMPEGGSLTIASATLEPDPGHRERFPAAASGPHVRIRVQDTGPTA